ncbi:ATP-binding protein [Streptomyces sp. NPDC006335]|uniref:ATP-binding protein n=1 Tax=Streptomyces sp. NPDC006335 TaxID=3156895 RepID=UPI0033B7DB3F
MTTTAVRPSHAVPRRDQDVMNQWVDIDPRHADAPPGRAGAHYVGVLRRIAAARIRHHGLGALTDEVMLLVSELVTNAVLHSGTRTIGLEMAVKDGFLNIAVIDGMPGVATLREADEDAESGRGLALVQRVAKERGGAWGTRDGGATTWCRLALPEESEE